MFADDTQLYKHFSSSSTDEQLSVKSSLENGVAKISKWMTENRLKLNEKKN
jgi:hypothetical protein